MNLDKSKKNFTPHLILAVALTLAIFQLYTAGVSMLTAWIQRDIHIVLILILVFLIYPAHKKGEREKATVLDMVLILLALASGAYIIINYQAIVLRLGIPTTSDIVFGIIMVLLILEASRRATGWVLVIIAGVLLLYNFIGPWIPGIMGHKGYSLSRVISQMYLTTEGIFSTPLGVSASYIFLFVFLTSMLEKIGMGDFLLELAMAVMGRYVGGPAKTAVLASGFMGTLSGSAVANVVGTGTFTIPLMKRNGYLPFFAGAVEAAASSGGQLMPPIMGAAAFIIAEFLGIPYISVVIAALIPAILYYLGVLFGVHFEACRLGLRGLPKEQLPKTGQVLKKGWHYLIPIAVLLYYLGVLQYTPIRSGFYAIVTAVVVSFFHRNSWLNWERIKDAVLAAAQNTIAVALACAAAGLVIGSINLTGMGLKLSAFIISISGGQVWLALILTAVIALIMGMGLPTTAAYIVVGTMAAPALVEMGLLPLAAHLFVFYFAIISAITPPVALAAYAAAGIAKDDPMKIGFTAVRLTMGAFIIPFLFAINPTLIAVGGFASIAWATLTAIIGIIALAGGAIGYVLKPATILERALLIVAAFLMLKVGLTTDLIGLALFAAALLVQLGRGRKKPVTDLKTSPAADTK
ncbi:MAG: TRAP transporter permease [Firmicutes bacterium]|jgi:TRAP transporter 4TM/12TM fusion protein|nr:TRAP transporter permease [Bacillota bacterium]